MKYPTPRLIKNPTAQWEQSQPKLRWWVWPFMVFAFGVLVFATNSEVFLP